MLWAFFNMPLALVAAADAAAAAADDDEDDDDDMLGCLAGTAHVNTWPALSPEMSKPELLHTVTAVT